MPLSVGDRYSVAEFHPRINSYAREFAPSWRYLLSRQLGKVCGKVRASPCMASLYGVRMSRVSRRDWGLEAELPFSAGPCGWGGTLEPGTSNLEPHGMSVKADDQSLPASRATLRNASESNLAWYLWGGLSYFSIFRVYLSSFRSP